MSTYSFASDGEKYTYWRRRRGREKRRSVEGGKRQGIRELRRRNGRVERGKVLRDGK